MNASKFNKKSFPLAKPAVLSGLLPFVMDKRLLAVIIDDVGVTMDSDSVNKGGIITFENPVV